MKLCVYTRMPKHALFTFLFVVSSCSLAQQPVLLILGTPHLNNPQRDMYDTNVDDVLNPKRQAEIVDLVNHLASFRPTRVALECAPEQQKEFDQRYADYRMGRYVLTNNERDQVGLRLAAKLDLSRVDCVDYQSGPPGPEANYDFVTFGRAHKELKPAMDEMDAAGKHSAPEQTKFGSSHSIIDWYRRANEPDGLKEGNRVYMRYIAPIGDTQSHPGANWVGGWHARNMIIVENLRNIAKPGDRIFTLFGAGHAYLLHEFAMESGSFDIADTEAYLR